MSLITPTSNRGISAQNFEDTHNCSVKRTRDDLLSSRDEEENWEDSTDDGTYECSYLIIEYGIEFQSKMELLTREKEKELFFIDTEFKMHEMFAKEFEQFSRQHALQTYQVVFTQNTITCRRIKIESRK